MTVFIIDDEIYIVEMLKKLINWEELGLTLLGTATDGEAALPMLLELAPDIIISDIKMPGYDGLSLLQITRQQGLSANWIMISGYKYFDYALNALKYGVKDYLLKPIKKNELNQILSKIAGQQDLSFANADPDFEKHRRRQLFIPSILNNTYTCTQEVAGANRFFQTFFQKAVFQFLIIKIDHFSFTTFDSSGNLWDSTGAIAQQQILSLLDKFTYDTLCYHYRTEIICFLNYDLAETSRISSSLSSLLDIVRTVFSKYYRPQITLIAGTPYYDFSTSHAALLSARAAVRSRILSGINTIIHEEKTSSTKQDLFPNVFSQQIVNTVETLNLSEYESLVRALLQEYPYEKKGSVDSLFYTCEELYSIFWRVASRMDVAVDDIPAKNQLLETMWECCSIGELTSCVLNHTSRFFSKYFDLTQNSANAAVVIAKRYVKNHYAEKITLNTIGQIVYLNPVYFSSLFKKETGMNFVDYLNEYRINIAKDLLCDPGISINSIAEKIGISNDSRYFSKLFKKIVGISPVQYRNLHS